MDANGNIKFFPDFDGTFDSKQIKNPSIDSDEEESGDDGDSNGELSNSGQELLNANPRGHYWQNENYWKLPENVRNAIDIANIKQKHTSFYHRLLTLNDKIFVFRSVFYGRMPSYQKAFYLKK
jgi:hypothetical protein